MRKRSPRFIKYIYKKRERLWVHVDKIENDVVYGKVANNPVSKGLTFNDLVKIKLSNVVDYIY